MKNVCNGKRAMTIEVDIQRASEAPGQPDDESFIRWAGLALRDKPGHELTIRLVDDEESRTLNRCLLYTSDAADE